MKKIMKILVVPFLILCLSGNAGADQITQSVYATLNDYSFSGNMDDAPVFAIGPTSPMIALLDMTYNPGGKEWSSYYEGSSDYEDGTIYNTELLSDYGPFYSFFSNATFTLGGFLEDLVSSFTEYERIPYYSNVVKKDEVFGSLQFTIESDILEIWGDWSTETNEASIFVCLYGEDSVELELNFGDPALLKDGPLNPVPEPTTILLLSAGLMGLAGVRRKARRS